MSSKWLRRFFIFKPHFDTEKLHKFSEKRCTAAIFCSGAYVHNKCVAEPEYSSYPVHTYIPHPPSLIMRGGEQQEQQKINTGLINPINSLLPDQAINSTIFVDVLHTHNPSTGGAESTQRKRGMGDTKNFWNISYVPVKQSLGYLIEIRSI